ncbi:MAG: peptidylprolyl isomerase [Bacteroidales bacterium]|nr:peptidylprolyl isomerase [Bacteroidales bacterium]
MKLLTNIVLTLCLIATSYNSYAQKKTHETMILIETTEGNMKIKLYDGTPCHRDNFIKLVKEHYYDGLLFHRVIDGFMIQGGDPESKNAPAGQRLGSGGPGYTIPAELLPQYYHKKGALAAARTGDQGNPMRRSSGSQFYIVQGTVLTDGQLKQLENYGFEFSQEAKLDYETIGGTPSLDAQYTVFGEVVEGLEVIDKIAKVEKDRSDRPVKDVVIIKASIVD